MADSFDVQCALEDAKGRVFTGLSRRVRPAHRDALVFTFDDGGEIEIPGSTPDFTILAAAVFETGARVGGVYVREMLNYVTNVALTSPTGAKIAHVRLMKPPSHMAEGRGDIRRRLEGRKIEAVRLSDRNVDVIYWDAKDRCYVSVSFDAASVYVNTGILPVEVDRVSYRSDSDWLDVVDKSNTTVLSAHRAGRALDRTADGGILTDTGDW